MKIPVASLLPVLPLLLVSCTTRMAPLAMTTAEYKAAINSGPVEGRHLKLDFHVHASREGLSGPVEWGDQLKPSIYLKYGQAGKLEVVREFIYPTDYDPAGPSPDSHSFAITPVNPTAFETRLVGWTIEVETEKAGSLIRAKGIIRFAEPIGMSKIAGGAGPIHTEEDIVVSENQIQFPRFAEYSTPFTLLMFPGKTYSFEVSHPKKGTMIDVVATPHDPTAKRPD